MGGKDFVRPFRWDLARRSRLGSVPAVDLPESYPEFEDDLLACCARVLGFVGDSELVFVGRSPQPLFDLLSGLLLDTSWSERLRLLDVSLRLVEGPNEAQLRAIYPYLAEVGLHPSVLSRRGRTVALVDVVATGDTLGTLVGFVRDWSDALSADWLAVARRLRIVGLTWREPTSPHTWRWQQHAEWVKRLRPYDVKNVAIPRRLFRYLAEDAPKTGHAFTPSRWGDEEASRPTRDREAREALALAVRLFDLGRTDTTRRRLAGALVRQPAMTERWFRSLVLELRT